MRKILFSIILFSLILCSCGRSWEELESVARENMPDLLEREMASYMETQGSPDIKDVMVIFQCDSMCVLQARASYSHAVKGAPYLDAAGLKEFTKTTTEHSNEIYSYFLATGYPVSLFDD